MIYVNLNKLTKIKLIATPCLKNNSQITCKIFSMFYLFLKLTYNVKQKFLFHSLSVGRVKRNMIMKEFDLFYFSFNVRKSCS